MCPSKLVNQLTSTGEDYVEVQIEAFLNERKAQNLADGTIRYYKDYLIPFINYLNSQEIKFISQITPFVIRDYLLLLKNIGHNEGGVHGSYRAVKAFLKWYWDELDLVTRNPIDKVKAPKVTIEPIEGVSKEDFNKLLSVCAKDDYFGERDATILLILLDTGVRANELCNINAEDVNLLDSSILIRKGKGRKPRFVFIGKKTRRQLRKWLRFRKAKTGALFINKHDERIVYITLREIIRRLSVRANIPPPALHDFRRTFCLECLRNGMDLLTISRLMGHTTLALLSRYAKQTKIDVLDKYKSVVDD